MTTFPPGAGAGGSGSGADGGASGSFAVVVGAAAFFGCRASSGAADASDCGVSFSLSVSNCSPNCTEGSKKPFTAANGIESR